MHTRQDYLDNKCTHEDYYSQFVNDHIKNILLSQFGLSELKKAYSKDQYLNTIELYKWDNLAIFVNCAKQLKECNDYSTLAGKVCILKESARQLIKES